MTSTARLYLVWRGRSSLRLAVADAAPEDQAPDDDAEREGGHPGPGPQDPHLVALFRGAGGPAEAEVALPVARRTTRQNDGQRSRGEPRSGPREPNAYDARANRLSDPSGIVWSLLDPQPRRGFRGGRCRRSAAGPRGRYRRAMPAFLDAAAGAPLHPVARAALDAALDDGWADPARLYGAGRRARLLLDAARESLAESVGARADELDFTPDATSALHAAVLGTLAGNRRRGAGFVHSAVEHSAVLHAARFHGAAAPRPRSRSTGSAGSTPTRSSRPPPLPASVPRRCRPRTTRSAPGSRWTPWPPRDRRGARSSSTRRRRSGRHRSPRGGRCSWPTPARGGPRRPACSPSGPACAGDRRIRTTSGPTPRSRLAQPAGDRGRRRRAARGAGRAGRAGRAARGDGRPDPAHRGRHGARRRGRSVIRSTGCRTSSPSPASTSMARRCSPASTGTDSRCRRARPARRRPSSRRTYWWRWAR